MIETLARPARTQLEMFRPPSTDPNVLWLADHLLAESDWRTAKEILKIIPADIRDNSEAKIDDRTIRAWAEAAAPKIISGQFGYKHTDHATTEEIKRAINTWESQGTKMIQRANKVRKYAHARIG